MNAYIIYITYLYPLLCLCIVYTYVYTHIYTQYVLRLITYIEHLHVGMYTHTHDE